MAHALRHSDSHPRRHGKQSKPQPLIHLPRNIDEGSQWVAAILLLFGLGLIGYAIFGMDTSNITEPARLRTAITYD